MYPPLLRVAGEPSRQGSVSPPSPERQLTPFAQWRWALRPFYKRWLKEKSSATGGQVLVLDLSAFQFAASSNAVVAELPAGRWVTTALLQIPLAFEGALHQFQELVVAGSTAQAVHKPFGGLFGAEGVEHSPQVPGLAQFLRRKQEFLVAGA